MNNLIITSLVVAVLLIESSAKLGKRCFNDHQCSYGECCADNSMIFSKRVVTAPPSKTCQPYLTQGQSCGTLFNGCGCAPGLQCLQTTTTTLASVDQVNQKIAIGPTDHTCV